MVCASCGAENAPRQKFCDECGTPLVAVCPSCGAAARPGARFCGECGSPLEAAEARAVPGLEAQARPTGERRLVSVLFADLVGFTSAAEARDAEEVRELLGRYFDVARETVGRYGGEIEKFIGDAVMAVWGTPTAHEDDAERAVRAALELVDAVRALGPELEARAAVLTGEAAVTIGATGQGMVAGDLVNTASRLQSVATPGTVLAGEATVHAASGAIAFERVGEQQLKGKSGPVEAYRALRVVAHRGGAGRSDLPEAPFVGRDDEFRLLKELLHTTGRDGRARLVSITGAAGIGKSRLAWELEKYVDGLLEDIYWHRGRSPAYGEGVTFWALGEMVRHRAGLAETDDEETTRTRLAETVAEYVSDPHDRRWIEPALLTLLGLEPPPAGGRDVLFSAWRMFFERVAERGTVVLVFEDLQWADTGLLDFVDHVLEWSRSAPMLLVTLARPELFERRPDWGAGKRQFTALALEPLAPEAMRELLAGLVRGLPETAVEAIVARADGIPLYAVETVRMLVGQGRLEQVDGAYTPAGELGELSVPDTLRSLIASRLDALEPPERALLQDASVLGQSFTPAGLGAVAGATDEELAQLLRSLVRKELLQVDADPRSPERGQYSFVQALIREVAYGTLARADRSSRHLAAARFFESLGDEELAGAVATHYLDAYRAVSGTGEAAEIAERAREALVSAADRASALGAHDQAIGYLELVMAITTEPSVRATLLVEAAAEANAAGQYGVAERYAREAIEILQAVGDRASLARATFQLGETLINSGQAGSAVVALEAALEDAPAEGAPESGEAEARLLAGLAHAYQRHAEYERVLSAADRALAAAERLGLDAMIADAMVSKATGLMRLGRRRESAALVEGAVRLAAETGEVALELRARNNLAALLGDDDPVTAAKVMREGLELAQKVGNRQMTLWMVGTCAGYAYYTGEGWDEAIGLIEEHLDRELDLFDRLNLGTFLIWFRADRGEPIDGLLREQQEAAADISDTQIAGGRELFGAHVALIRADGETAWTAAREATRIEPGFTAWAVGLAASAALLLRDVERLRLIEAELAETGAFGRSRRANACLVRASIAAVEGRRADAVAGFHEALSLWRDMRQLTAVAQCEVDFAFALGPDDPDARAAAEEAREIFARLGATAWLERLEAVLGRTAEQIASG
jgi:class 3 adenylate cyclase/tetratricopeptide (TPR) repeat protein